jgi:DMSO/TMAO reductase YedYZ heme-binding membrane subunit
MSEITWYVARSTGIVAWALVTASVIWGLLLSGRSPGGRLRPNWLLDLHRFLGGSAVVLTGIHMASLLVDRYTDFGVADVLLPFSTDWHPGAVAWGIAAMYLLAAVELTSLLRRRMSKRAWKATHLLSYPVFAASTIHLLTAGTDAANPLLRYGAIAAAIAVAGLTGLRIAAGFDEEPARSRSGRITARA